MFPPLEQLRQAMQEAGDLHHQAEQRLPTHPWPLWYSAYVHTRVNGGTKLFSCDYADRYVRDTIDRAMSAPRLVPPTAR